MLWHLACIIFWSCCLAAAELPLLHMLRMNSCEAGPLSGLETAGLERFGLPELRAMEAATAPLERVRFALSFVLEAMLRDDACPLAYQIFPVGEVDEEDLWSVDECYHVLPAQRMHGERRCLEITHHYC